MNILFVAPRIPYPLDTGGKIRTFNLLKQAALGHRVTLLSFSFGDEPPDTKGVFRDFGVPVATVPGRDSISMETSVSALLKNLPLSVAKYHSRAMARAIIREVRQERIDLVYFDHIHMGQYIRLVPGVPAVVDEHNVESLILSRLARNERNPPKRMLIEFEAAKMARLEKRVCSKALRVLFVSEEDKLNFENIGGDITHARVIPNGVDTLYFRLYAGDVFEEDAFVFTGSMDWQPNSDAVWFFVHDVLPKIWKEQDDVRFYVVGKNPPENLRLLARKEPRVIVTGSVPDVRPYVAKSKLFVVPLRIGGGTRLKILEAMSMNRAVLSTSIGAEGIEAKDGVHLELADRPEDFAAKALSLLRDDTRRRALGEAGRKFVRAQYEWKIIGEKLNSVLGELSP